MVDMNMPTKDIKDPYLRMLVKGRRLVIKRYENELKKLEGIELACPYVLQSSDFQYLKTTIKGKEAPCQRCFNADRFPSQAIAENYTKGGKYKVISLKEALEQDIKLSLGFVRKYIEQEVELTEDEEELLKEAGMLETE